MLTSAHSHQPMCCLLRSRIVHTFPLSQCKKDITANYVAKRFPRCRWVSLNRHRDKQMQSTPFASTIGCLIHVNSHTPLQLVATCETMEKPLRSSKAKTVFWRWKLKECTTLMPTKSSYSLVCELAKLSYTALFIDYRFHCKWLRIRLALLLHCD